MTAWIADTASAWTAGSARHCSGHGCTEPAVAERLLAVTGHFKAGRATAAVTHATVSHDRVYGYCAEHLARLGRRVHDGRLQVAVPTLGRTA